MSWQLAHCVMQLVNQQRPWTAIFSSEFCFRAFVEN